MMEYDGKFVWHEVRMAPINCALVNLTNTNLEEWNTFVSRITEKMLGCVTVESIKQKIYDTPPSQRRMRTTKIGHPSR